MKGGTGPLGPPKSAPGYIHVFFIGHEFRVVILSVVRTHHSIDKDLLCRCSLYTEERVLNTAFTRVQSLIVTAAHPLSLITRGHMSCRLFWASYLSQSLSDEECDQLRKEFIKECQVGRVANHWQLSPEDFEVYSMIIKEQTDTVDLSNEKEYYDQILNDLEKHFDDEDEGYQDGATNISFDEDYSSCDLAKKSNSEQGHYFKPTKLPMTDSSAVGPVATINNSVYKYTHRRSYGIYKSKKTKSHRAIVYGLHSPYIKLLPGDNRQLFTITVKEGAESGYALTLDPKEKDIWLPDASALNRSFRGDTVAIDQWGTRNSKGRVVANISSINYSHPKEFFVCHTDRRTCNLLVPINKQYPKIDCCQKVEVNRLKIYSSYLYNNIVYNTELKDIGKYVYLVRLDHPWANDHVYPRGVPIKRFKLEGGMTTYFNILKFNYIPAMPRYNGKFLSKVSKEVKQKFPKNWEIPSEERGIRKIHKGVFTIDDEETVVLDDALSLECDEDENYIVNVHIADASYFVTPGSTLDRAALERGRTFYINHKSAMFMLPDDICMNHGSLNPGKERLAVTTQFVFSKEDYSLLSQLSDVEVHRSIVCSLCQLTKEDAGKILLNSSVKKSTSITRSQFRKLKKDLLTLGNIATELRKSQWPDSYLYEPDRGKQDKYTMAGSSLVEMFMCLCNTAIPAKLLKRDGQVGPVIVHEPIKYYKQEEWLEHHHHLLEYFPVFKRMIADEAIESFIDKRQRSADNAAQNNDNSTQGNTAEEEYSTQSNMAQGENSTQGNVAEEEYSTQSNMTQGESSNQSITAEEENLTQRNMVQGENSTQGSAAEGENSTQSNMAQGQYSTQSITAEGENLTQGNAAEEENSTLTNMAQGENSIQGNLVQDENLTQGNIAQADKSTPQGITQDNKSNDVVAKDDANEFLMISEENWQKIYRLAVADKNNSNDIVYFLCCSLHYFPELYVAYQELCMSQSRSFYHVIDTSSVAESWKYQHSHFSKIYTHFTSPLRRYCDLLVHRALLSGRNPSLPSMEVVHKMNIHKWDESEFSKQRNMHYFVDCCRRTTGAIAMTAYVGRFTNTVMELHVLPELQEVLPDRICKIKLSHLQTKCEPEDMHLLKWNVEIIPAPDYRPNKKQSKSNEEKMLEIPFNTLGAIIKLLHEANFHNDKFDKAKFEEVKQMIKTYEKSYLVCKDVEQDIKPSCHKLTITKRIREYSKLDIQLTSRQVKSYAIEPTVSLVHISKTFSCCLLHVTSPIQCYAPNISRLATQWSPTAHNMLDYVKSWQSAVEAESITNSTSSSRVPLIIKDLKLKWVPPKEAQFSVDVNYRIKYQRPFNFGDYVCIQYHNLLLNPKLKKSRYFELDESKKVTWVAHGRIVNRKDKENVKIIFSESTTLPETSLSDIACDLEVIPLQITFRCLINIYVFLTNL